MDALERSGHFERIGDGGKAVAGNPGAIGAAPKTTRRSRPDRSVAGRFASANRLPPATLGRQSTGILEGTSSPQAEASDGLWRLAISLDRQVSCGGEIGEQARFTHNGHRLDQDDGLGVRLDEAKQTLLPDLTDIHALGLIVSTQQERSSPFRGHEGLSPAKDHFQGVFKPLGVEAP